MTTSALQEFLRRLGVSLEAAGVPSKSVADLAAAAEVLAPFGDLDLEQLADFLRRAGEVRRSGEVPAIAVPDGVSLEECEALKDWRASKFFSEAERAALAYIDAIVAAPEVPDDIFNAVRKHYSEREVVELTVLAGTYIMHNRVTTALRIDLEPAKS